MLIFTISDEISELESGLPESAQVPPPESYFLLDYYPSVAACLSSSVGAPLINSTPANVKLDLNAAPLSLISLSPSAAQRRDDVIFALLSFFYSDSFETSATSKKFDDLNELDSLSCSSSPPSSKPQKKKRR